MPSATDRPYENLWDLRPKRAAEWERTGEGKTVILVPKFRHPLLARWVMPYLRRPYFRINLDDVGTAIWERCDGATTVSSIADGLQQRFGAAVEPVEGRITHFLRHLERGDLVTFDRS